MKNWNQLLKYALLGTERMPLDPTILPAPIQHRLKTLNADNPETQLLQAVALTWNFDRAGTLPKPVEQLPFAPAPAEILKIAPPQYNAVFYRISDLKHQRLAVLELFFDKLIAQKMVISPTMLMDLMPFLTQKMSQQQQSIRAKIWAVGGERAQWLAQFKPEWKAERAAQIEDWEAATPARRLQIFTNWVQQEPQRAIDELVKNWEAESPKTRKEWLETLVNHHAALPILEANYAIFEGFYNEIQANSDLKKEPIRRLVYFLSQILLRIPQSNLFQNISFKLKKYVKQEKKLLGLTSVKIMDLPKTHDAFFEPQLMENQLGFPPKSTIAEWSDAELWFYNLVNALHPRAWELVLEEDWATILKIMGQIAKRTPSDNALYAVLVANLGLHRYEVGIRNFLNKNEILTDEYPLLDILTNAELEAYAQKLDFSNSTQPRNVFLRSGFRWSRSLSVRVLNGVLYMQREPYQNVDFALSAFKNMDLTVIPDLHYWLSQPSPNWTDQQRATQIGKPLLQLLEIREAIELL